MVAHCYNPSTWEVETGGYWVQGQLALYREIISQNQKLSKQTKTNNQRTEENTFHDNVEYMGFMYHQKHIHICLYIHVSDLIKFTDF
jgi:hypothetical protein